MQMPYFSIFSKKYMELKKDLQYLQQIEESLGKANFDILLQMLTDINKILKNIEGEEV